MQSITKKTLDEILQIFNEYYLIIKKAKENVMQNSLSNMFETFSSIASRVDLLIPVCASLDDEAIDIETKKSLVENCQQFNYEVITLISYLNERKSFIYLNYAFFKLENLAIEIRKLSENILEKNDGIKFLMDPLFAPAFFDMEEEEEQNTETITVHYHNEKNESLTYTFQKIPRETNLQTFFASEEGKSFRKGMQLLFDILIKWGEVHGLDSHGLNLLGILKKNCLNYEGLNSEENKKHLPFFQYGIPLLKTMFNLLNNEKINLAFRKEVFFHWIYDLTACLPGIHTHIGNACTKLYAQINLPAVLMERRLNLAQYIFRMNILRKYNMSHLLELHYENIILEYFSKTIAVKTLKKENDYYLDLCDSLIVRDMLIEFSHLYPKHATLKTLILHIVAMIDPVGTINKLNQITHDLEKDELIREDECAQQITKFSDDLSSYGEDKKFLNMATVFSVEIDQKTHYYTAWFAEYVLFLSVLERLNSHQNPPILALPSPNKIAIQTDDETVDIDYFPSQHLLFSSVFIHSTQMHKPFMVFFIETFISENKLLQQQLNKFIQTKGKNNAFYLMEGIATYLHSKEHQSSENKENEWKVLMGILVELAPQVVLCDWENIFTLLPQDVVKELLCKVNPQDLFELLEKNSDDKKRLAIITNAILLLPNNIMQKIINPIIHMDNRKLLVPLLISAIKKGNINFLKLIHKTGISFSDIYRKTKYPYKPLNPPLMHFANDESTIQFLLNREKLNINAVDSDEKTALRIAVTQGKIALVAALLKNHALVNKEGDNKSLLSEAFHPLLKILKNAETDRERLEKEKSQKEATLKVLIQSKKDLEEEINKNKNEIVKLNEKSQGVTESELDNNDTLRFALEDKNRQHKKKITAIERQQKNVKQLIEEKENEIHLHALQVNTKQDGYIKIIQLLHNNNASINKKDLIAKALLYLAVDKNNDPLLDLLLALKFDLQISNATGDTLLFKAFEKNHMQMVKKLLAAGMTINSFNEAGHSLLYHAIDRRQPYAIIVNLLNNGADPNLQNKCEDNAVPLSCAIQAYNVEIAQLLIEHGAKLDPLLLTKAIEDNDNKMVGVLCSLGINLNQPNAEGTYPLLLTATKDFTLIDLLIQYGADVNLQLPDGNTLLMKLIQTNSDNKNRPNLRKILTSSSWLDKADLTSQRKDGDTVLHIACRELPFTQHEFYIGDLLRCNACAAFNFNLQNNEGDSILHILLKSENIQLEDVKRLLAKGANPYLHNKKGQTPIDCMNYSHQLYSQIKTLFDIYLPKGPQSTRFFKYNIKFFNDTLPNLIDPKKIRSKQKADVFTHFKDFCKDKFKQDNKTLLQAWIENFIAIHQVNPLEILNKKDEIRKGNRLFENAQVAPDEKYTYELNILLNYMEYQTANDKDKLPQALQHFLQLGEPQSQIQLK